MAQITFKGNSTTTSGDLPTVGSQPPVFTLTNGDLEDVSLDAYQGKKGRFKYFFPVSIPLYVPRRYGNLTNRQVSFKIQ